MNKEKLAWAAGILDGEGCFRVHRQRKVLADGVSKLYLSSSVTVRQTDRYGGVPQMLSRLQDLFGGEVRGPYAQPDRRDAWQWRLYRFEAVQYVMCCVWPWLGHQKRRDAIAMMLVLR